MPPQCFIKIRKVMHKRSDREYFPYPIDLMHKACINAINKNKRFSLVADDTSTGEIKARVGISLWSWGENVTISLNAESDTDTSLVISSNPVFKLTLVDYGKNRRNINTLLAAINAELPR